MYLCTPKYALTTKPAIPLHTDYVQIGRIHDLKINKKCGQTNIFKYLKRD